MWPDHLECICMVDQAWHKLVQGSIAFQTICKLKNANHDLRDSDKWKFGQIQQKTKLLEESLTLIQANITYHIQSDEYQLRTNLEFLRSQNMPGKNLGSKARKLWLLNEIEEQVFPYFG